MSRTKVVVVSLSDAEDRRRQFQDRAKTDLNWSFVDAHTSIHPDLTYAAERSLMMWGRRLTEAEIGCYSSHYSVLKALIDDDEADQYVVIEDDVIVDWRFVERLADEGVGEDFVKLNWLVSAPYRKLRGSVFGVYEVVELKRPGYGTTAYLVTKRAAPRLVSYLCQIIRPIDAALESSWEHRIPNIAIFPCPVIHAMGPSYIGHDERWLPAPKPLWMRGLRAALRAAEATRRHVWNLRRRLAA